MKKTKTKVKAKIKSDHSVVKKQLFPLLGVAILGAVAVGIYYLPADFYTGDLRGVAEDQKTIVDNSSTPTLIPNELAAIKPQITTPTDGQVLTDFPRTTSIAWTDSFLSPSYNVEITCDYCTSKTVQWSDPTVYTSEGLSFSTPELSGDYHYRVRVQGVTANGTGLWSDYRYFSYDTISQLQPPKTAPEIIAPGSNTASNAFTTNKFGMETNEFQWTGVASNINYYVDYQVCLMANGLEKCIDTNVGQPKGTFIDHRVLTSPEWETVKDTLLGTMVADPNNPPLHIFWKVKMLVTSKATGQLMPSLDSEPGDFWIYL